MAKFKENERHSEHEKMVPNPWDCKKPDYDQRSGRFIECGTNYGVGKRQPVGSMNGKSSDVVPMGKVDTMKLGVETPKRIAVE